MQCCEKLIERKLSKEKGHPTTILLVSLIMQIKGLIFFFMFVTVELLPKQLLVKDVTTNTLTVIWGPAECDDVTYYLSVIPDRDGLYPVQVCLIHTYFPPPHHAHCLIYFLRTVPNYAFFQVTTFDVPCCFPSPNFFN